MPGTEAPKRKRNLWTAVAVALVTAAGVAVWQLWPASAPAVAVPDRVCERTLPGNLAADFLPETGDKYWENVGDEFGAPYTGPTPDCILSAGGRRVMVEYNKFLDTDRYKTRHDAEEKVERVASNPGSAPLRLGEARGYASKHVAILLLNCSMQGYPGTITASVFGMSGFPSDSSNAKAFAELTAETLRLAARDVYKCPSGPALPTGSPSLGQPRAE
ncbi:hypothetical protein ABT039_39030 [Streptomyces lasiicapitis]|uniref:hypothetical protein n=1 Tax=Streptomyces lasiicapitis TaxID=1923961 RepID=UPI003333615A